MSDLYLRPCPFCGGEAEIKLYSGSKLMSHIRCQNCGSRTKDVIISLEYCSVTVAASLWNRRTEEEETDERERRQRQQTESDGGSEGILSD